MTKTASLGYLFILEGPDGIGKTTIIEEVFKQLGNYKLPVSKLSFPGKQVGTLGKLVYDIHHNIESFGVSKIHQASLQMLHVAAHIDTIQHIILPSLQAGEIVLLDRYWWSTVVYGKAEGIEEEVLDTMIKLENYFWENKQPEGVFLLQRNSPLREEVPLAKWNKLKEEYTILKTRKWENILYLRCLMKILLRKLKNI